MMPCRPEDQKPLKNALIVPLILGTPGQTGLVKCRVYKYLSVCATQARSCCLFAYILLLLATREISQARDYLCCLLHLGSSR